MGVRERFTTRKAWRNDTGNQRIYPLRELTPTTLDELCHAVREAERDRCTVRAVGSGHSWSDVALSDGMLVRPTGLTRPLDLGRELLHAREGDGTTLVRVEAGITIAALNEHLHANKLALPNMGGFDGQTVAGVISTSTHGSGFDFGPLPDLVRSLDVVGSRGIVYRIEPPTGRPIQRPTARATPTASCARTTAGFAPPSWAWGAWG